ncbi:uncharacterized protein BYT42DRAFT_556600 [Radiomyces spectabilis]|uniref:uncharacterized protein n=1 Tax=Radiomyces spectabilis TaxID=64574 RepID=UPI00221FA594|nr:uncharacterized protein BYT42DRAFT_556600 [Radiomyces spectabilis]KAI8391355.1 hypothetical protein BYT42DRAFT_556600 [Radiomyces spectabilis]
MTCRSMLDCLPMELIDKILGKLSMMEYAALIHVNRTWYAIALQWLYHTPRIESERQIDQFVNVSGRALQHVIELDLTAVSQFVRDDHLIQLSEKQCNRLRVLRLSNCNVSPEAINRLLRLSVNVLQTVLLSNCNLSSETLETLGQASVHHLRTLDLSNTMIRPCATFDAPNHLEPMTKGYFPRDNQLVELDLSYCSWVDNQTLKNVFVGLPSIQRLSLCWCHLLEYLSIFHLVRNLTQLHIIDLRFINAISCAAAYALLEANANLSQVLFTHRLKPSQVRRKERMACPASRLVDL